VSSKIKNGCCSTIHSASDSTRNGETRRGKTSPLQVDPTPPVRAEETKSSRQVISHLLVVDDEEYICEVIREMLSDQSYRIHTLCDPEKALDFIRTNQVDLVLTDLIMGKKSGVDVLQQTIRSHPDGIVVLMTGHPTIENAVTVLRSGAYDYLVKPFSMDTLKAVVKRGLEKQRLYRENINLKETVSLYKISEAMGSTIRLDFLLNLILETAIKELDADMATVLLSDGKNGVLTPKASLGVPHEMLASGLLTGQDEICKWVIKNGRPRVFDGNDVGAQHLPSRLREAIGSAVAHPLMAKGKVMGILILIRLLGRVSPFSTGQLHSLSIIASKAASALENSKLYEELKDSYLQTLTALANAVEARDIYTRGHTDRVCYMAQYLCREMGWNEEQLWEVKMGGILHDIGKIGVPDAVLNKGQTLTQAEFEIMKEHPACGARILEGISFLAPAVPFVLYHHERFDGKGYPYGLRNHQIPIQGRLMAVVDTFDAMTSDRPYRKAKTIRMALQEIKDCAGTQFDPDIAHLFLTIWEKGLLKKSKLPGKKNRT
jgi:response regulator RpfG family c-di-GMP phosphodiesterase